MLALLATAALADDLFVPVFDRVEVPDGIINGDAATEDDWPMTGGLLVSGTATVSGLEPVDGRALMCSSTLIAPDVVLLAAHCVDVEGLIDAAATQGYVVESYEDLELAFSREANLSRYDLMDSVVNGVQDWPADVAFASEWIPHPDFDLFTLQTGLADNADIALMFLEAPIAGLPLGVLPTEEEAEQIEVGASVEIVGWGQQQQDAVPGTVGEKVQATSFVAELNRFEMKIGEEYTDSRKCHGDSGGPTFMQVETTSAEPWRLIGVTSHAYDTTDCNVTGGVDTRVDRYLSWIDEEMRSRCEDGSRSWCEEPGILPPPSDAGTYPWDAVADAEEPGGCGCAGRPAAPSFLLGLGVLGFVRRRR